jgi:hypothetical protein
VVKEKHGAEKPSNATNIICKFFLDAVEGRQYGWFWKCPNGSDCKYRWGAVLHKGGGRPFVQKEGGFGWLHVCVAGCLHAPYASPKHRLQLWFFNTPINSLLVGTVATVTTFSCGPHHAPAPLSHSPTPSPIPSPPPPNPQPPMHPDTRCRPAMC